MGKAKEILDEIEFKSGPLKKVTVWELKSKTDVIGQYLSEADAQEVKGLLESKVMGFPFNKKRKFTIKKTSTVAATKSVEKALADGAITPKQVKDHR